MIGDLPPVPLRSWRLRNFKAVRSADIAFAHLNVLVGANSSGKSSLIQSILAASQAVSAPTGGTFPLNGPEVRLGEFRDLLYANAASGGEVAMGGSMEVQPVLYYDEIDAFAPTRTVAPFRQFRPGSRVVVDWHAGLRSGPRHARGTAVVRTSSLSVEVDHRIRLRLDGKQVQPSDEVNDALHRFGLSEEAERGFTLGFAGAVRGARSTGRIEFNGVSLKGGIPVGVLTFDHVTRLLARQWLEELSNTFRNFSAHSRHEREQLEAQERKEEDESPEATMARLIDWAVEELAPLTEVPVADALRELRFSRRQDHRRLTAKEFEMLSEHSPDLLDGACAALGVGDLVLHPYSDQQATLMRGAAYGVVRFLSENVRYLGPLREDPQVVYRSAGSGRSRDIGPKGEFAAAVLHASALQTVRMPTPDGDVEETTLQSALNFWLRQIGAAEEISTEDRGALGYDMRVRQSGLARMLDLTSVGVGVSQLLPVLMMCLLSEPGDLLLLEQPELHLHPALQQDLADFLLACARSGRQLVVETHSEYLVSRLRRRIAEDRSDLTLAATQLVFVERDAEAGSTQYRPVPTNRYGGIEDWPRDFFAQTPIETQEILRQGLVKSDLDEDMVVGFIFRSPDGNADNDATERVLEALARRVDRAGKDEILIDLGPFLGQYEPDGRPKPSRSPLPAARPRQSTARRRAVNDLVRTIAWRAGSVEDLVAQAVEGPVFMVRVVGIALDVAESVDAEARAKSDTYIGAYEFAARTAEDLQSQIETSLVRRFSIIGDRLTVLPMGMSTDDAAGVLESWRRADLFDQVTMG
jgi:predicted ATPase